MSKNIFNNILIIGLGLIGGSFAKALRRHIKDCIIYADDLDENAITMAIKEGIINKKFMTNEEVNFDLIIIATPLSSYKKIFAGISPKNKGIMIDLGSVKSFIYDILPKNLRENFVACHPIAGSQNSGFENSTADLFTDKKFIICSNNENSKKIADLAIEIKAQPIFMESKKHDEIYALMSHLPQFISFLTKEFSPDNIKDEFLQKAFRLDDSDPKIWEDIFALNQKNLEKFYVECFENLAEMMEEIEQQKLPTIILDPIMRLGNNSDQDNSSQTIITPSHDGAHSDCMLDPNSEFFTQNFPAIFFRALIALSYLKIKKISDYQEYAGPGFRDFTSITEILKYDRAILSNLVQKHNQRIIKIFNEISS